MFVALLVTALICVVLGMGMPTTGCYIIVSTLVAPVLSMVAHKNGITAPPIALHLFVFYFGLMADVTPPVGIASYAAAAIASANSFKTGVQSFLYNIKTMVIPFMFMFDSNIILYGVDNAWMAAARIVLALVSVVILCTGMQGYFVRRNRVYESIILQDRYYWNGRQGFGKLRASSCRQWGAGSEGYVVVPMNEGFVGDVSEMMYKKIGVSVKAEPVDGRLLVSNISSDGYVFADIWQGDFITGLSISRESRRQLRYSSIHSGSGDSCTYTNA
ncbi:hypothetical protein GH714_042496 [Hevea brasiliensis]|uniref:TRAP C4-dicarboxylate transport system permease DctM subunit domain-containing protein n=1 Tax=Hevea brasiliensis TaxID=3981 RepID=A0A6A6JYK7_HEVBR|nr:hypothetical protein GH714_042496 [Hevea brasiliensis]